LARQSFNLSFKIGRIRLGQSMTKRVLLGRFRPDADRGPVLLFALCRFAAICRSLAIVSKLPIAPINATLPRPNGGYSAL
jgi:hypothetical protein